MIVLRRVAVVVSAIVEILVGSLVVVVRVAFSRE